MEMRFWWQGGVADLSLPSRAQMQEEITEEKLEEMPWQG